MKNLIWSIQDNWFMYLLGGFIVILIWSFMLAIEVDMENKNRLMQECMLENPEYECYSLIKKKDTQMVPVFIPMGR